MNVAAPTHQRHVAIVGMSGRFPMAPDLDAYWHNLSHGVECISALDAASAATGDAIHVAAGGVLEGVDLFDAPFFGVSARDAEAMDPQHRVFLECAWHSLEVAGYDPATYPGPIGVFAGAALSSYLADLNSDPSIRATVGDVQLAIGNDKDHLTTQVAYRLNLRGPSLTVQTACSTSLVAVCVACESLLNFGCDMALAGGVAADLATADGYRHQPGGILSADGHCRTFDAAAGGTVPGNGVGIVVLKRLADALADRDHIHAVILGSAVNNDGNRKVGYTAPSVVGQAEVIAMAHAAAGVDPAGISYVEAHGTGTPLGDPIEIAALNEAFGDPAARRTRCAIGSVKSNIGHLDTAAGIAGLIKTVLSLEHKRIPPTLHFTASSPAIDFAHSAFRVHTELTDWPTGAGPRRAGVSSFGIGGTNAHVVLEEPPTPASSSAGRASCLITVSARTAAALETMTDQLAAHLDAHPEHDLGDVAYTGHVGRRAFAYRRALVCAAGDRPGAHAALESRDRRRVRSRRASGSPPPVAFLFPGQGTQTVDMGLGLYRAEPIFRTEVDRCAELLGPRLGLELRDLLYPARPVRDAAPDELRRTSVAQPAVFTVEYALARLWIDWGVRPAAMLGHSVGEWVAACLAGVVSLEDALTLIAARGRCMDALTPGAMLAVNLPEAELGAYLAMGLDLAAANGPAACVLSGPFPLVERAEAGLRHGGIACRRLATSHAFHSAMMDDAIAPFVVAVADAELGPPRIPFVSGVTGRWIEDAQATSPTYWGEQLRRTVRFADGVRTLDAWAEVALLEVGPGRVLADLARALRPREHPMPVLSSLDRHAHASSDEAALEALGELWLAGVEVDWPALHRDDRHRRVPLPTYPFERRRYSPTRDDPGGDPGRAPEEDELALDVAAERPDEWFHLPGWMPNALTKPPPGSTPHRRWLVLGDGPGVGGALVDALAAAGEQVVPVGEGTDFAVTGDGGCTARPDAVEDLLQVLGHAGALDAVVHLWAAGPVADAGLDAHGMVAHRRSGYESVVALAQALERSGHARPLDIHVVSRGVFAVTGRERLCPPRATLIGPCRVIPQEYPHLRCGVIDLDSGGDSPGDAELAASLLDELMRSEQPATVALRGGRRWEQTFDRVRLDLGAPASTLTRPGGCYLITGGLGNIGHVVARYLAETTPDAKLVLTGRSPLRGAATAGTPRTAASRREQRLSALEEMGATVVYFAVDVADRAGMAGVVAAARQRFGPIRGVVHGAGDLDAYFPLAELDRAATSRQFAPKVDGLLVLDELVPRADLDFVLLHSSLAALAGGVGLAGYAAANCFLDGLAAYRHQDGGAPWITVNWDAWAFADDPEVAAADTAISPAHGEAAFAAVLARAPRQVAVSADDPRELYVSSLPRESVDDPGAVAAHGRPPLSTDYVPPRSETELAMVEIWQQLLGVAPVGRDDNFFELGGHSLLAIQLVARCRTAYGVEMSVAAVFECPTLAGLAASVERERTTRDREAREATALLDYVESLSEGELRRLLAQQTLDTGTGGRGWPAR